LSSHAAGMRTFVVPALPGMNQLLACSLAARADTRLLAESIF
jgi:hypothetical protein